MNDQELADAIGTSGRICGAIALAAAWVTAALLAPILAVPMLGCGACLAIPFVAVAWVFALVLPADLGRPLHRRLPGAGAMLAGCALTAFALVTGLDETGRQWLAWSRHGAIAPSLDLGLAALAVVLSALAYGAGFQLRWGFHPLLAGLAGILTAAVVPATCAMLVTYGLLGLPMSA